MEGQENRDIQREHSSKNLVVLVFFLKAIGTPCCFLDAFPRAGMIAMAVLLDQDSKSKRGMRLASAMLLGSVSMLLLCLDWRGDVRLSPHGVVGGILGKGTHRE